MKLIITSMLLLSVLSFTALSITNENIFSPFDSTKIEAIMSGYSIENKDDGYLISGTLWRRQLIPYVDYPAGIYLLNVVPDDDSLYKIKYYTEFYFDNRAIYVENNNTRSYTKDNGNLVVINCHDYYYGGAMGFSMYKIPLVIEFDSLGKYIKHFTDTTTQDVQLYGKFNQILVNDDKSFYQFHNSSDKDFYKMVVSLFDKSGKFDRSHFIRLIPRDSGLNKAEYPSIVKVLRGNNNDYICHGEILRYHPGNQLYKKETALLMRLDSNFKPIYEKEYADFTDDDSTSKLYHNTYFKGFLYNNDGNLLINGYTEKPGSMRENFIHIYDPYTFELLSSKEWNSNRDSIYNITKQASNGDYIAIGDYLAIPEYKRYNSLWKFYNNFEEKKWIKYSSDYPGVVAYVTNVFEKSPGVYDLIMQMGDNVAIRRVYDTDFVSGIIDSPNNIRFAEFEYLNESLVIKTQKVGRANIGIFDIRGSRIASYEIDISNEREVLHLTSLSNGVYLITLEIAGEVSVGRIVAE